MARIIKLTSGEAKVLFDMANQMRDDLWSYTYQCSEKCTEKAKRKEANEKLALYESAMSKIRTCFK